MKHNLTSTIVTDFLDAQAAITGRCIRDFPYAHFLVTLLSEAEQEVDTARGHKLREFVCAALECGSFGEEGVATEISLWRAEWTTLAIGQPCSITWATALG